MLGTPQVLKITDIKLFSQLSETNICHQINFLMVSTNLICINIYLTLHTERVMGTQELALATLAKQLTNTFLQVIML